MSDYPKVLYRAPEVFTDWQEVGRKIGTREIESVTVRNEQEEAEQSKKGFAHASKLMEKKPTLTLKKA